MRFRSFEFRYLRGFLPLILFLFSEMGFAQPISNKLDISISYGWVSPFGNVTNQIDGIKVPSHFAQAKGNQTQSVRVSYNYNRLLSFGLNIGQFNLKKDILLQNSETFNALEVSPLFTVKRRFISPWFEFRFNLMPLVTLYKTSICLGDIVYNGSNAKPFWIKSNQLVPGVKSSLEVNLKGSGPLGLIGEAGVAFFRDNQKITSEVTNSYFFAQIGISYSLFYNKRYYLYHE